MKLNLGIKRFIRRILNRATLELFKFRNTGKKRFHCPICGYRGPFKDIIRPVGNRKHALCPSCGALERHRLQYLVLNKLSENIDTSSLKIIHFAPEAFLRKFFMTRFGSYETADIHMHGVDHSVDLVNLPFEDESYDFVYASHVLEHVQDDIKAISEIRRILRSDGIAVLPVPLTGDTTIEYPEPNPNEANHVRAPGLDYYDRFDRFFSKVEKFTSDRFPEVNQLYVYEDRTQWPTEDCPLLRPSPGEKHIDLVPVCYV